MFIVCLSISLSGIAGADEVTVTGSIDSAISKGTIAQSPTVVRVIALHDVPESEALWKPTQPLSAFDSIVDSYSRAIGVAFAIDGTGNLATAAHVVKDSKCVWIVREDGIVLPALIVGIDQRSDLAVIRAIDSTRPFEFADAKKIEPSTDLTLLTGANRIFNSFDAKFIGDDRSLPTLTRSSGRDYSGLIEFAGVARAGDSGSPIVDDSGRVVGMLCAVIERADSPTSGFAIPFDSLTLDRLHRLARGKAIAHGYAGVELSNHLVADRPIIRIESIATDSPTGQVLRTGDQIKSIDNQPMMFSHQVSRIIDASPDQTLSIEIVRKNNPMKIDLRVRERIVSESISPDQFIWSGMIFPSGCFDEVITSDSIGQITPAIAASELMHHDRESAPIEIWRGGTREQ